MKRLGVFGACWRGIAIACTLLLATPSTAFADASTGMSYRGPQSVPGVGLTYVCEQSTIADVADNRAWTRTAVADGDFGCTPGQTVNSGYLGVQASGFRNGGYCGTTGYYYSNLATYQWEHDRASCRERGCK